jgi:hypothetical protein
VRGRAGAAPVPERAEGGRVFLCVFGVQEGMASVGELSIERPVFVGRADEMV